MLLKKPQILLVDDVSNNLIAMRRLLRRVECEIFEASSGNEALKLCLNHNFALILLDVDMPVMDGYEVALLLNEEPTTEHIPIIFVTAAYEDQEHLLKGYRSGAVDYIQKPVDDIILLSKVRIFLDLYHSQQTAEQALIRSETLREAAERNEKRFHNALMDAPIPVILYTEDDEIILLNQVWTQLSGYSIEDIPTIDDWLKKAYGEENFNQQKKRITEQFTLDRWCSSTELDLETREGKPLTWLINSRPLPALNDGRKLALAMCTDITERKQHEEQMRLSALVFENSNEGMMITDANGKISSINPAFTNLTGYTQEEALGQKANLLKSGHHDQTFYQNLWHNLNTKGYWQGEIHNRRKDGSRIIEWLSINTTYQPDGRPAQRVAIFSDITKKKQNEEIIWRQANFDSLTGLYNRRMFSEKLGMQIHQSKRDGQPFALIYLDLDEFKDVNDTLGHDKGDDLLKETALRLKKCVRKTDIISRLGGDEFTIIINNLDKSVSVERVAMQIINELSQPFQLADESVNVNVSASLGITLYPNDAEDTESLLKNADQAMYAAKQKGRRGFCYFTPSMQQATERKMRICNDLHIALEEQQFELYYQPIVRLDTGLVHKAEALIRWIHPEQGLVSPVEFIPIAEETGMIIPLGNWVFNQALQSVARWQTQIADFQISINKSPIQFTSKNHDHQTWLTHLKHLNLDGSCLVIELTEGLLLELDDHIHQQLRDFREANIELSIDDFGTGYSSLAYLQNLDIDYLKIDRRFVNDVESNDKNQALCTAMIVMAHKLGLKVIAEGIETEAQKNFLQQAGCDYGQGYFFAKPLPAQAFETFCQMDFE